MVLPFEFPVYNIGNFILVAKTNKQQQTSRVILTLYISFSLFHIYQSLKTAIVSSKSLLNSYLFSTHTALVQTIIILTWINVTKA